MHPEQVALTEPLFSHFKSAPSELSAKLEF